MQERTLTTAAGTYRLAEWDGVNRFGAQPVCDMVLVLVDGGADKSDGGVLFTDGSKEQASLGSCTGIIVAVGPQAFAYDADRMVKWEGVRPQPGNRIWFQRYAGQEHFGLDGKMYRIMQDRSIALFAEVVKGPEEPEPETKIVRGKRKV